MSPRLRRALALALVSLLAGLGLWAPALLAWDRSGWGDWQWFHHSWEVGRVALRRWGEWPLWNPHHCGGVPQWGQPQAQSFSPLYLLLALPFGTVVGHKLFLLAHHAIGFAGLYGFARREERLGRAGSFLAATIWTSSGFAAWHFAGGHATFLAFLYYPFLLSCWRRADRDVRWCAGVAAILTEILLEGGHYPFPYAPVLLGFDSLARLRPNRAWPLLRTLLLGATLTLLLGAMRWVPILIELTRHPRPIEDTDALRLDEILEMWTAREHAWTWPPHPWVWAEYGTYVGWGVVALGAIGIAVAARRARLLVVAGFLLFLAFSMGYRGPLWPSSLLHRLPFFGNLHVPSRWQVVCTMYLALLAAHALDAAERWLLRRRWARDADWARPLLPWAVAAAIAVDLCSAGLAITNRWDGPPIGEQPPERPHLVAGLRYLEEYANYPSRNVGTMQCYEPVPWPRSRSLWIGDVPQVRIVGPDGAARQGDRLHGYDRTNHTVRADVELAAPGRAIFNQNHDPRWTTNVGAVASDDGRLAVDLPAGRHRVVLRFEPEDLPWSVLASALGAAICLAIVVSGRRRRA